MSVAPSSASAGVFGVGALAARHADDLVLGTTRDVHRAVARRVWQPLNVVTGGAGRRAQLLHDALSTGVYAGISGVLKAGALAGETVERRGWGPRTDATPGGRLALSAVNGLFGDQLVEEAPDAAITMAVRVAGRDVPLTADALTEAFPGGTGDLVVFVHGLMENEEFWFRDRDIRLSYGEQLAVGGRWTPLHLRVNTGLSLAENGVALASLLDRLVAAWPEPVRRLALVGHSMGGLIVRAAGAVRLDSASPWTDLVTDVVTLGTPHLGADLERLVAMGSRALGLMPESAPFARLLERRSAGITGLRRGLPRDVLAMPHARYRLVAATLGPTRRHPLSRTLGDLLVRPDSALGRDRGSELFPGADTLQVPNAHHFDLLNHPDIHRKLEEWLC